MKQQPKLMDVFRMKDIFEQHAEQISKNIYFNTELAIVHSGPQLFRLIMSQQSLFTIDDHRLGMIVGGEADICFNLVDRHLSAGTLVYLGPGSIVSPIRFSEDLEVYGIALFNAFNMPFSQNMMPTAFKGQVRDFQLPSTEADMQTARNIIDAMWHLVHQKEYHRPTAMSLAAALMHHYDNLYQRQTDRQTDIQSREQTIFDRFISLVNRHATQEHKLTFYASKMCLTQRYLSTVIHQASGLTAKEWIDRAIVTHIKVELKHTNKTVSQIADEMNFTTDAFFCKYFKRLTGLTPLAYRMKE